MTKFRTLRADEVEVRVAQVFGEAEACTLLLYKDARCDMAILDETVGAMNWQRHHSRDNANCTVSIWDDKKQQWISKEDVGAPSNTEAEKGLASDSFKRACVNWGIGRELYTAPFIYVKQAGNYDTRIDRKGNKQPNLNAKVTRLEVDENKVITALEIINTKTNAVIYSMGGSKATNKRSGKEFKPAPKKPENGAQSTTEAYAEVPTSYRIKVQELSGLNKTRADECAAWVLEQVKAGSTTGEIMEILQKAIDQEMKGGK